MKSLRRPGIAAIRLGSVCRRSQNVLWIAFKDRFTQNFEHLVLRRLRGEA